MLTVGDFTHLSRNKSLRHASELLLAFHLIMRRRSCRGSSVGTDMSRTRRPGPEDTRHRTLCANHFRNDDHNKTNVQRDSLYCYSFSWRGLGASVYPQAAAVFCLWHIFIWSVCFYSTFFPLEALKNTWVWWCLQGHCKSLWNFNVDGCSGVFLQQSTYCIPPK